MEDIIHFKLQNKEYTKSKLVYIASADVSWLDDWIAPEQNAMGTIQHHYIDEIITEPDEIKSAILNNDDLRYTSNTILVTENKEKNTISLKRYYLRKNFVITPKSDRRQFKIKEKYMISLTINKLTGDFSLYKKSYLARNKNSVFVRKNISSEKTRNIIHHLQSTDHSDFNMNEAIGIFVNQLGYPDLNITDYNKTIEYFYDTTPPENKVESGLMIFPFLNYLRVNKIEIMSYYNLYYFEYVFNKNKSNYRGKTIVNYISDYYKITDELFLMKILNNICESNMLMNSLGDTNKNVYYEKFGQQSYFLDYTLLRLLNDLPNHTNQYAIKDVFYHYIPMIKTTLKTANTEIWGYDDVLKCFNNYNVTKFDMIKFVSSNNKDDITKIYRYLKLFSFFNIKLKIDNITDILNPDKVKIYKNLINNLFEAVNKSGTFALNPKSLVRIKLYFKDCTKINLLTHVKFKKMTDHFDLFSNSHDYEFSINSAVIRMVCTSKDGVDYFVGFNPITSVANSFKLVGNSGDLYKRNFIYAIQNNKKSLTTNIDVKFLYSKMLFEDLCVKNNIHNLREHIDYIDDIA